MRISGSDGHSLAPDFNPASLKRYDVIVAPIALSTGDIDDKLLIVLQPGGAGITCIKPTTDKGGYYKRHPELMPGCVIYESGVPGIFPKRTIIDPKKTYHVLNRAIARDIAANPARFLGSLPVGFHDLLVEAIRHSRSMSDRLKIERLLMIGVTAL